MEFTEVESVVTPKIAVKIGNYTNFMRECYCILLNIYCILLNILYYITYIYIYTMLQAIYEFVSSPNSPSQTHVNMTPRKKR